MKLKKPLIIGIAGGSGSGKTSVTNSVYERFKDHSVIIGQDFYYKDQAHLDFDERLDTNYDHLVTKIKTILENETKLYYDDDINR